MYLDIAVYELIGMHIFQSFKYFSQDCCYGYFFQDSTSDFAFLKTDLIKAWNFIVLIQIKNIELYFHFRTYRTL